MDYDYAVVRVLAEELVQRLQSSCAQIEIAGSLRRKRPKVHDIEIVAEPLFDPVPAPEDRAPAWNGRRKL